MSRWRPLDDDGPREPRPIQESLDHVARQLGFPKARALGALFSRWREIVGEAVAEHARPLTLADGVLRVAVDEPGWATQLRYLTPTLMARCAEVVGDGVVSSVEVTVRH